MLALVSATLLGGRLLMDLCVRQQSDRRMKCEIRQVDCVKQPVPWSTPGSIVWVKMIS